ncbi:MAG: hypothetical protein HQL56_04450 [Magnetococcales bacterium]|nr:hypothetical protein [Magnetococcales bacterium]
MDKYKGGSGFPKKEWQPQGSGGKTASTDAPPKGDNTIADNLDAVLQQQLNDKLKAAPKGDDKSPDKDKERDKDKKSESKAPEAVVESKGTASGNVKPDSAKTESVAAETPKVGKDGVEPANAAPPAGKEETPPPAGSGETGAGAAPAPETKASAPLGGAGTVAAAAPETTGSAPVAETKAATTDTTAAAPVAETKAATPDTTAAAPVAETKAATPDTTAAAPVEASKTAAAPNPASPAAAPVEAKKAEAPVTPLAPLDIKPAVTSRAADALAEKKAEMAHMADRFSDLARTPAQAAPAKEASDPGNAASATPRATAPEVTAAPVAPTHDEAPAMPRKDAFVAAAEKERVLKMIRDAASKKMEEGFDLRAMKAGSHHTETAKVVPPVEEPRPSLFAIEEDVTTTSPLPVAETAPEASELPAATLPETTAVAEAAVAESPAASTHSDEVLKVSPGGLVPPVPRVSSGPQRTKSEAIPSAAQARINEAYLRQLKGQALDDEPTARVTPEKAAPAPAVKKATRRAPASDPREVPVESLGEGIFNALGDMVGGVVNASRSLTGKVRKVVVDPEEELAAEESGIPLSGTDRAAKKMAKGVTDVAGGVGGILKGGGNIVLGTIGVVTMPVVGAVGAIFRAFKPSGTQNNTKE